MASAGPRGRSRDSPITRMRIRVSSRMGTSEHRRRKKLQETPDINHTPLVSSMRAPGTLHRPYNSSGAGHTSQLSLHHLLWPPAPNTTIWNKSLSGYHLQCLVPLCFSLLESELPNLTPVTHTLWGCPPYNCSVKIQNSLAQGTGMKEEEEQMESGTTPPSFMAE